MARWPVRSESEQGAESGSGSDRPVARCVQADPWARLGPVERQERIVCLPAAASAQVAETLLDRELAQEIVSPPQAARSTVLVAVLPGHRAHASAVAVPARVAEILERPFPAARAAAQVRLVFPAVSARSAEEAAQGVALREALRQPEERAGAALGARNAAALPRAVPAEAGQHEAGPRPEEAQQAELALAAAGAQPAAAVGAGAERHAAVEVVAALGAAAVPQPVAVVAAERDGAVRPQAVAPGAAGRPQAVRPLALLSASVCRPGRLLPWARPPAPRPAARSARGRPSLQWAAPKWRWWQAARDEG
jgi:hypothetical protein